MLRISEIISARIADRLKRERIPFAREVPIAGVRPDFVVTTPDNRLIVVEIKNWPSSDENIQRAAHQAELYKQRTGAAEVYVLIPSKEHGRAQRGVVNETELIANLVGMHGAARQNVPSIVSKWAPRKRTAVAYKKASILVSGKGKFVKVQRPGTRILRGRPKTIFAAMPFAGAYDDVFVIGMAGAAEKVGVICERVDHQAYSGDVVDRIKQMIRRSSAVIADLSESRPNVLYELAYATALQIPAVQICSTPLSNFPFDVRNRRTIPYSKGQTHKLIGILARELKGLLS